MEGDLVFLPCILVTVKSGETETTNVSQLRLWHDEHLILFILWIIETREAPRFVSYQRDRQSERSALPSTWSTIVNCSSLAGSRKGILFSCIVGCSSQHSLCLCRAQELLLSSHNRERGRHWEAGATWALVPGGLVLVAEIPPEGL